jgi:ribosomal protein S18 acetylase RimI-like enzyme
MPLRALSGLSLLDERPAKDACYIEHIAVDAKQRDHGVGTLSLDEALSYARAARGYTKLALVIAASNKKAIKLYGRLNYVAILEETSFTSKFFVGVGRWVFMEREL